MLPANLLTTLKALALTDKPLITTTPDKNAASTGNFELGQKIQGSVQAQVSPGVFKVRVADQLLNMQLPAFIKAGDTIALQVISLQPRLTFGLAASSNPISTPEQLSAASRLLSSLSQQPLEKQYVQALQSAPLWTGAQTQPDSKELAGQLQNALSQSGLFYESHQAQWVEGRRNVAQLMQEPQNQLSAPARTEISTGASPTQSSGTISASPLPSGHPQPLPNIPDNLQPLVQQQLNALETRQVLWQGMVWPEQEMRWKVQEEPRHTAARDQDAQWSSQVELNLPNLGTVAATLRLSGNSLSITLSADHDNTRQLLTLSSPQLASALAAQGLALTQSQVTQEAPHRG